MLLVSAPWDRQGQLDPDLLGAADKTTSTDLDWPQFVAAGQKEVGRQFGVVEVF